MIFKSYTSRLLFRIYCYLLIYYKKRLTNYNVVLLYVAVSGRIVGVEQWRGPLPRYMSGWVTGLLMPHRRRTRDTTFYICY